MNYQTAEQLTAMKLNAMRLEYARQDELPASQALSFDDRLGMIVTAQCKKQSQDKSAYTSCAFKGAYSMP